MAAYRLDHLAKALVSGYTYDNANLLCMYLARAILEVDKGARLAPTDIISGSSIETKLTLAEMKQHPNLAVSAQSVIKAYAGKEKALLQWFRKPRALAGIAKIDYSKMLTFAVKSHIFRSVEAALDVGHTDVVLEDEKIINSFAQTLTPEQYQNFDLDAAHAALKAEVDRVKAKLGTGTAAFHRNLKQMLGQT